jgi:hypothetical protein
MEQWEDGDVDHNVLARPTGEEQNVTAEIRHILALLQAGS